MRSKACAALFVAATCFTALFAAWASSSHYEFEEVCYLPGPASCTQMGFAPPDGFREVRFATSAHVEALGPWAWRIRIGVFDQSIYSILVETLVFIGPVRERRSQVFGRVHSAFHTTPEGGIVEVHFKTENRTYWVKLRRVP